MDPERENPPTPELIREEESFRFLNLSQRAKRVGAVALSAISLASLVGKVAWEQMDKSGDVHHYEFIPEEITAGDSRFKQLPVNDDKLRIANWNMHNKTRWKMDELRQVSRQNEIDIFTLQEVSREHAGELNKLKGWHVTFVMADTKTKPRQGGYGNVILTRQEPRDITSKSIRGTAYLDSVKGTLEGALVDGANAEISGKNFRDGRQEDRAALAMTVEINDGMGGYLDARIIASHIAGAVDVHPSVHARQLKELEEFILENLEEGRPTFFCGDLNAPPAEIVPWFENIGFRVMRTSHQTSIGLPYQIDYCAYNPSGLEGSIAQSSFQVRKNLTDHYLTEMIIEMQPPKGLSLKHPH